MASARWPSIALVTTGAVLAGLIAAAAAFVPWLSAPQTLTEPFQRDPSTPVVHLRDGRNISYQVPWRQYHVQDHSCLLFAGKRPAERICFS